MLVFESARVFADFTGDLNVFFFSLMQSYSQISSLNARATLDSKKFENVEVSTWITLDCEEPCWRTLSRVPNDFS